MIGEQNAVFFYGVTTDQYENKIIDDEWLDEMKLDSGPVNVQKGVQCGRWYGEIINMKCTAIGLIVDDENWETIKKKVDEFSKMSFWEERGLKWNETRPKFNIGLQSSEPLIYKQQTLFPGRCLTGVPVQSPTKAPSTKSILLPSSFEGIKATSEMT